VARTLVSVGPEAGELPGSRRVYPLSDLSVLQLAYVLDDLVDELDSRGVWTGPRPTLRLEPIVATRYRRAPRLIAESRIPGVDHD
jgi:hypothetical protein